MGGQKAKLGNQQHSSNPEVLPPHTADDSDYTHVDAGRPVDREDPETLAEQHEAGAMAVKGDSKRKRADVSLESLKERTESRNYDQEIVDQINKINFSESPEAQEENFAALREVSTILVALALRANPKRDFSQLDNFENFASALPAIHPAENTAIHKLRELVLHKDSDVSKHFKQEWAALVRDASFISTEIRALEEADFKGKGAEKPGVVSKTVAFAKKHPLISLGIAIAGAVGLYKIVRAVSNRLPSSSSSGEKKEGGGIFKWVAGIGIAVASIFGLGKLLGMKGIKEFFAKKFDWKLDDNRMVKALTLISQGKFKEASEVLWEGVDENKKFHTEIAKHITKDMNSKVEVTGKTVFELRDDNFGSFINGFGQTQDDISLWAHKYGGSFVSYIGFDTKKKNEEQIVVRKFLQKHEARIRKIMKVEDDTSIEDVLQALHKDQLAPKTPEEESNEPGSVDGVIETVAGKEGIGVDGTEAAGLKERFKDKSHFQKFLNKYEGQGFMDVAMHPATFLDDLFSACKQDEIPVLLAEGSIFLIHGDKAILFSSVEVLWKTAMALVAAPFTDKVGWSDAIGNYLSGAAKFVIIGAIGKGLIDKFTGKGFLPGALKGAKAGFLFPIEIPRLHIAAGQRVYRAARGAEFVVRRWVSAAEAAPKILEEQAKFHAQIAREYDRLIGAADAPLHRRNWWGWYTKDRAIELRQEHLRKFRLVHNELQQTRTKMGLKAKPELSEAMLHGDSRMERVNEFLTEEGGAHELARPIDVKGALFKNSDGSFRGMTEIKADAARLKTELADPKLDDAAKRIKQRELFALESYLTPAKGRAFEIIDADFNGLDAAGKIEKVHMRAAELEAMEKGVQARFNAEVEGVVAEAKLKKLPLSDPSVTASLEKLDDEITIPFARQKQSSLRALTKAYNEIPANKRTPLLRSQMRHAIDGVDGTVMTRIAKGAKGRAKMMVLMASLMFATDQIIHRNDAERDFHQIMQELGPDMKQLLFDVLPFAGTYSNFYSAWTGRQIIATERDVSGVWDRTSNVIWGTVGLAGDILTALSVVPSGGGSLAANAVLRLTKAAKGGSKVAARLLQMWPRITKIADRMGGWYEFAKKAQKYVGQKPKVLNGLRKIQTVGMVAGAAMLAGGVSYHLYYGFVDEGTEIELPSDLQAESPTEATPVKKAS